MKINKRLLPIKGYNFFFNAAAAPVYASITIIACSIGFSTKGIGSVLTLVPILSLVTKPISGMLADKFSLHKIIFVSFIVINAAATFSIQWFAYPAIERRVSAKCANDTWQIDIQRREKLSEVCFRDKLLSTINSTSYFCQLGALDDPMSNLPPESELALARFEFPDRVIMDLKPEIPCTGAEVIEIDLSCSDVVMYKFISQPAMEESGYISWPQLCFAILLVSARVAASNSYTFADTICFNVLGDRPQDFGFNRSFGAAGWGAFALIGGLLIDWYSLGKFQDDYTLCFYVNIAFNVVAIVFALTMKFNYETKKTEGILGDVKKAIFAEPQFMLFLVVAIFCGAFSGFVWSFLLWYVEDIAKEDPCAETGWLKTLEGLILVIHTYVGEIGFFLISGWMVKRIGHLNCLTLVVFVFGVRFLLISIVPNPWWLLPVEVMNGITYATYLSTSTSYANTVAPEGTKATVQGIMAGTFDVGICMGIFFGGYSIDIWGGRSTFRALGFSSICLAVAYSIVRKIVEKSVVPKKAVITAVE